nr:hypothetical protein [Candidatus Mycoplasma haematolamae]
MRYKAIVTSLGLLGAGGTTGATYQVINDLHLGSVENTKETVTQKKVTPPQVRMKSYSFAFGDREFKLECPETSSPYDSLDRARGPNPKLAIYCQALRGKYREVYDPKTELTWDSFFNFKGSLKCTATDATKTKYRCDNPGKLRVENIDTKRMWWDISDKWIRIG